MPEWVVPMLVLGAGASLSNFGGAVGLGVLPLTPRMRLEVVVAFVAMEVLLPVVGLTVGANTAANVGNQGRLVAGVVLVALGVYTVVETRREARDLTIPLRRRTVALLAFALSLDNLAVGFGLGLLHAPLLVGAAYMGVSGLVLTGLGLRLGRLLGSRAGERAELFSGLILIGAGILISLRGT